MPFFFIVKKGQNAYDFRDMGICEENKEFHNVLNNIGIFNVFFINFFSIFFF